MDRLLAVGRSIFALGMFALGLLCFIDKDFVVGRPPSWPAGFPLQPWFAYVSGALLMAVALCILANWKVSTAGWILAVMILVLSFSRHLIHFMETWPNANKTIALMGACLVIVASGTNASRRPALITIGALMLAEFLFVGGYSHFKYAAFVKTMIPTYIPFNIFWTYFAGICLLAGGLGIVIPFTRPLAALLCSIMIGGWFLLLHIPRFFANTSDVSDRLGVCESFAFCGVFLVLYAITKRTGSVARGSRQL